MSPPKTFQKRSAADIFDCGVAVFDAIRQQGKFKKEESAEAARQRALQQLKANRAKKLRRDSGISASESEASQESDTSNAADASRLLHKSKEIVAAKSHAGVTGTADSSPAVATPSPAPPPTSAPPTASRPTASTKQQPTPRRSRAASTQRKGVARPVVRKVPALEHKTATPTSKCRGKASIAFSRHHIPKKMAATTAIPRGAASNKRSRLDEKRSFVKHAAEPANRYQLSKPGKPRGIL